MKLSVGESGGLLYMISQRVLDTLLGTNRDLYPAIYSIISIFLTMLMAMATSERSFSAMRRVKS